MEIKFDFVKPNVISVSQPVEQIGVEAANLALQLIDNKSTEVSAVKKIVLPTSIISVISLSNPNFAIFLSSNPNFANFLSMLFWLLAGAVIAHFNKNNSRAILYWFELYIVSIILILVGLFTVFMYVG